MFSKLQLRVLTVGIIWFLFTVVFKRGNTPFEILIYLLAIVIGLVISYLIERQTKKKRR